MLQNTYLFLGFLAGVGMMFSISTRFEFHTRILAGAFAMVAWIVWAFASTNVVVYDQSGNPLMHRYEALFIVGMILAAIEFLFLAVHVLETFGIDPKREFGVRL